MAASILVKSKCLLFAKNDIFIVQASNFSPCQADSVLSAATNINQAKFLLNHHIKKLPQL
jgi:hypothetical protein